MTSDIYKVVERLGEPMTNIPISKDEAIAALRNEVTRLRLENEQLRGWIAAMQAPRHTGAAILDIAGQRVLVSFEETGTAVTVLGGGAL